MDVISFNFGENTDGQTATTDEGSLIGYNKDKHVHRKRFTVAHELGHLVLGHTSKHGDHFLEAFDGEGLDLKEIEANQFAAELLVPLSMIKEKIENGTKNVDTLVVDFWVSRDVMFRKIMDNNLLNKIC